MIFKRITIAFVVMLSGCSEANLTGTYVGGSETEAYVLEMVQLEGGKVEGSVAVAEADYENGKVKISSRAFAGVGDGKRLSVLTKARAWGASDNPVNIDVKGDTLVVNTPGAIQTISLSRSDQQDYRRRVEKLEQNLNANDVGMITDE